MIPDSEVLEWARAVREAGFFARLALGVGGVADVGAIRVTGRDALAFLHSQVTNEVEGLAPGAGNYSARVTAQGQLLELFSLHRLSEVEAAEVWLILERDRIASLVASFEEMVFSDDVAFEEISDAYRWSILEGARAGELLDRCLPLAEDSGSALEAFSSRALGRAPAAPEARVIRRSFTGDRGFLFALPIGDPASVALEEQLAREAAAAGFRELPESRLGEILEVLRVEAGSVRIGPDTRGRKRVLPETGLEQLAVSYGKGCYLGQEVIARIRTYGSLPFGLRGLVFAPAADDGPGPRRILEELPAEGEPLIVKGGESIGQIASRTLSPTMEAAIAYAYLDRAHRTPGTRLLLALGGHCVEAEVRLLPFYSAPEVGERVAWLYDQGVRSFAEGREERALGLFEEALRIDPGFSDGYEAVGVVLGRRERFHEAIDVFKRLEEIAPDEPMVHTNLSLYFMKVGDKENAEAEAARAMQKEMARQSGRSVDTEVLDRVLVEQQRSEALRKKEMFAQVLEIDPEDGIALFGLGNALATLGQAEEAVGVYERASRAEGDNSAIHLAHGKALEKLGRDAEARSVYGEGMEVASRRGDLLPLKEMEHRLLLLRASASEGSQVEAGEHPLE
jgi:folate-binding protein YgfZ